jgi:hypothetical protein
MAKFLYYLSNHDCKPRESVIDLEAAEKLADLFDKHDLRPHATKLRSSTKENDWRGVPKYVDYPDIMEVVEALDCDHTWRLDVSHLLEERRRERRNRKIQESFAAVDHAGIAAYLMAHESTVRGLKVAEVKDLSYLTDLARGKYRPDPNCRAKLCLSRAVHYAYEQAPYADYNYYAVPAEVAGGASLTACRRNLQAFCDAIKTHNGFAGSGAHWSASIETRNGQYFVVLISRASISD